jgi:hypothetical protein
MQISIHVVCDYIELRIILNIIWQNEIVNIDNLYKFWFSKI